MKDKHVHDFKPHKKTVLLGEYRVEDGKMRYINTVGRDILKQFVCKCGAVETVDLTRVKA